VIKESINLGSITAMICEKQQRASLTLVPAGMEKDVYPNKAASIYGMAQLHVRGDGHETPYARGLSMTGSNTAATMRMTACEKTENGVVITLKGAHGLTYMQTLTQAGRAILCCSKVKNDGDQPVTLDQVASFCLAGMTPFEEGLTPDCLVLHRFTSFWSAEGRHQSQTIEELNLETSWSKWAIKNVRIGQGGTLPVRGWFPVMALEDTRRNVTWAVNLGWAGAWNMELFRQKEDLVLTGGLTNFDDGHFRKTLAPGEEMILPEAGMTVVKGGMEEACEALLDVQAAKLNPRNETERTLNPMYNEYCDTWGKPTKDTVRAELEAIKDMGLSYFVIDAGWFGEEKQEWGKCTGDWTVRKAAFPEGLKIISDEIRAAGMIPGLWFEAEVAAIESKILYEHPEMFVKDDGKIIIETDRAFLNLTQEDAQAYLKERIIDFLRDNGFGYIKVDYNNTYGLGFDGFESLGESQRQCVLGTHRFFDAMRKELPELVIENCSSGGHRLEMSMMQRSDMASFSDAHECADIPLIAADLHRLILPRQSQIWSVIRKDDSLRRIIWSQSATLLGRMCVSGPVDKLNAEQMDAVRRGVEFYREAAPIIAEGSTRVYRKDITNYDHAHGWQAAVRCGEKGILVVAHAFENNGGEMTLDNDFQGYRIADVYADAGCGAQLEGGRLTMKVNGDYCGMGILLVKE